MPSDNSEYAFFIYMEDPQLYESLADAHKDGALLCSDSERERTGVPCLHLLHFFKHRLPHLLGLTDSTDAVSLPPAYFSPFHLRARVAGAMIDAGNVGNIMEKRAHVLAKADTADAAAARAVQINSQKRHVLAVRRALAVKSSDSGATATTAAATAPSDGGGGDDDDDDEDDDDGDDDAAVGGDALSARELVQSTTTLRAEQIRLFHKMSNEVQVLAFDQCPALAGDALMQMFRLHQGLKRSATDSVSSDVESAIQQSAVVALHAESSSTVLVKAPVPVSNHRIGDDMPRRLKGRLELQRRAARRKSAATAARARRATSAQSSAGVQTASNAAQGRALRGMRAKKRRRR